MQLSEKNVAFSCGKEYAFLDNSWLSQFYLALQQRRGGSDESYLAFLFFSENPLYHP